MSERIYLNNDWLFTEDYTDGLKEKDLNEDTLSHVRLPHTVATTPFNYFEEESYQMVSGYRRHFYTPESWRGKKILLTIDGAAHEALVYVNGVKSGEHHCGYTAFTMDITDYVEFGADNIIAVRLDSRESLNQPPFGFVIDYMTYGGLYRGVWVDIKEPEYISDVFCHADVESYAASSNGAGQSCDTSASTETGTNVVKLYTELTFSGATGTHGAGLSVRQSIRELDGTNDFKLLGESAVLEPSFTNEYGLSDVKLWDIASPALYEIKTELLKDDYIIDTNVVTFGFRDAVFKKDGFYLNRKKVRIRGLNRHQCYPYVGYAMPEMMQRMDADILKDELGVNAVRTSHYPQSHYFLDECDRKGLLVFTEIPGWQHIGDSAWKHQAVENVRDMVAQYRNHASIILWGVRINESVDDDEFYVRTNAACRELDPTRQTGGVRAHKRSSLLEDVYTYNDFVHNGIRPGCEKKSDVTSDMEKPYMVTEYNGHMYPTKPYDWEEHRTEHALRHARVLNAVAGEEDIAGSFGWCMFDYNTHKDFGSGDRICYHGVLDMFRNPKLAAYVYAAQQDEEPVLSVTSSMDIGEHPGCYRGQSYIISNADSVRMYKNDRFIKEYKSTDTDFTNLSHGPVKIDEFVGDAIRENESFSPEWEEKLRMVLNEMARYGLPNISEKAKEAAAAFIREYGLEMSDVVSLYNKYVGDWGEESTVYRFEAVSDGKVVKTVVKEPMHKIHLDVVCDHTSLRDVETYDVASLRITAKDEDDNVLSFYGEPITVETEGPIEVIGSPVFSLKGGMGGTYIKTTGVAGEARVTISCAQAVPIVVEFKIET